MKPTALLAGDTLQAPSVCGIKSQSTIIRPTKSQQVQKLALPVVIWLLVKPLDLAGERSTAFCGST